MCPFHGTCVTYSKSVTQIDASCYLNNYIKLMVPTSDREYITVAAYGRRFSGTCINGCGNVQRHKLQVAVRLDVSWKRWRLRRGEVS